MKINIDMEAWELATVIKGLTINAQPEEKKPTTQSMSGEDLDKYLNKIRGKRTLTEQTKPILSDKTREELRKALANAFRVPERLISEDNPNPNYRPPMGGSHQ